MYDSVSYGMWSTLLLGGFWGCSLRKYDKSKLFEVASGGFWDPRRLVAEMLLHVEIILAWNLEPCKTNDYDYV